MMESVIKSLIHIGIDPKSEQGKKLKRDLLKLNKDLAEFDIDPLPELRPKKGWGKSLGVKVKGGCNG